MFTKLGKIGKAGTAVAAAATVASMGLIGPAAAAPAGAPGAKAPSTSAGVVVKGRGCPRGYVCMYTKKGWHESRPEHRYYRYGCHRLHGEYGERYVYNNQKGRTAYIGGWEPSRCSYGIEVFERDPGQLWIGDITPINGIALYRQ